MPGADVVVNLIQTAIKTLLGQANTFTAAQTFPAGISGLDLPLTNIANNFTAIQTMEVLDRGGQVYNVKAYGAKGDGVTDDTAAIQSAINAAQSNLGGIVFFPRGAYVISASLTINVAGVSLVGVNRAVNWTDNYGSEIIAALSMASPLISITANHVTVEGFVFGPISGSLDILSISVPGTSITGYEGISLKNLYSSALGGYSLSYVGRSEISNVVAQGWYGTYGLELSNCQIVKVDYCNMAPAGAGTSPTAAWAVNYYLSYCESITMLVCEANNTPYYGLWALNTNDSQCYDFESNGVANVLDAIQVYIDGCTDFIVHRIYILQPSWFGMYIHNSSIIQVLGGWIAATTQATITCDGGLGAAHDIVISGLAIGSPSTAGQPSVFLVNAVYNVSIIGNTFAIGGTSPLWFNDSSTNNGRNIIVTGNTLSAAAALTVPGALAGGVVTVSNNPGYNPVGLANVAIPASGIPYPAAPYNRTFYVSGGAVSSITLNGTAIGSMVAGTFQVPASNSSFVINYSTAPTVTIYGD